MKKLLVFLFIIKFINGDGSGGPVVITAKGTIKGLKGDGDYAVFLGVPYAVVDERNPFRVSSFLINSKQVILSN